jgi:hypothetical protein
MFEYQWKEPSVSTRGRQSALNQSCRHALRDTAALLADAFDKGEAKHAMKIDIPEKEFDGAAIVTRGSHKGKKRSAEEIASVRYMKFANGMRAAMNSLNKTRERNGKSRLGLSIKHLEGHTVEICAKAFSPRPRKLKD